MHECEGHPPGADRPHRYAVAWRSSARVLVLRASVGSTEASASLPARFGVVGPTPARGMNGDSPGRTTPGVSHPCAPLSVLAPVLEFYYAYMNK